MKIWKQKCVVDAVAFYVEFSNFQHLQKIGIFQFFIKSFPQQFLVLSNTLSNSFRLCKFKKLTLKSVSLNVT